MNRFNIDPVFSLRLQPNSENHVSNLVTMTVEDKIEKEIYSMTEYKDAKMVLQRFMKNNEEK